MGQCGGWVVLRLTLQDFLLTLLLIFPNSKTPASAGRRRSGEWLRECPPQRPSPTAPPLFRCATHPSVFGSDRCWCPWVYQHRACRIRSMGHSAQRHQGGGRRPGDSRGAECPVGLIPPRPSPLSPLKSLSTRATAWQQMPKHLRGNHRCCKSDESSRHPEANRA
jgi:hypothetical protein